MKHPTQVTCYHEAGHAVAAVVWRRGLLSVRAYPGESMTDTMQRFGDLGNAYYRKHRRAYGKKHLALAGRSIIVAMAGVAAEKRFNHGKPRIGQRGDLVYCDHAVQYLSKRTGAGHTATWNELRGAAGWTVNAFWPVIEMVARALRVRSAVGGREVRDLLHAWARLNKVTWVANVVLPTGN